MEERALFVPDGDAYVGTILIQGGWSPDQANGGCVLALLGHCLDDVPSLVPMTVSRFTADLVRPVPLGQRLHVTHEILREGKKIQVVQLTLRVGDVEHVRATALRLRDFDLSDVPMPSSTTDARPGDLLTRPDDSVSIREVSPQPPGFLGAVDMRKGQMSDGTGMGTWVRLEVPVVAGEAVRPTARLTFGFDYTNLVGVGEHPGMVTMINPDVTAHVLRPPVGEWIAITGDTRFHPAMARGLSSAWLSDDEGPFALASLSQLIQLR